MKLAPWRTHEISPRSGYAWLAREFKLNPMPHHVESFTSHPGERRTVEVGGGRVREIHPLSAIKLEGAMEHLDFALKREGLHLGLLRTLLPNLPEEEVVAFVRATPTGANARRVWYLYEQFAHQGRLSGGKRHKHFEFLSDDEVRHLETAIQAAYHGHLTELPSRI